MYKIKLQDKKGTYYSLQVKEEEQEDAVRIARNKMILKFPDKSFHLVTADYQYKVLFQKDVDETNPVIKQ